MGSDTSVYTLVDRERVESAIKADEYWMLRLTCGHAVVCGIVVLSDDVAIESRDAIALEACPLEASGRYQKACPQEEGCVREVLVKEGKGSENSLPDIGEVIDELVDREGWTPGKIEAEDTDHAAP